MKSPSAMVGFFIDKKLKSELNIDMFASIVF